MTTLSKAYDSYQKIGNIRNKPRQGYHPISLKTDDKPFLYKPGWKLDGQRGPNGGIIVGTPRTTHTRKYYEILDNTISYFRDFIVNSQSITSLHDNNTIYGDREDGRYGYDNIQIILHHFCMREARNDWVLPPLGVLENMRYASMAPTDESYYEKQNLRWNSDFIHDYFYMSSTVPESEPNRMYTFNFHEQRNYKHQRNSYRPFFPVLELDINQFYQDEYIPLEVIKIRNYSLGFYTYSNPELLEYSLFPTNAYYKEVDIQIDDTSIASINQDNYITPHNVGSTTIHVTSVHDPSVSDSMTINVQDQPSGP